MPVTEAASTKGVSLGLGLGLGIYGPIILASAIAAIPCYLLFKEVEKMRLQIDGLEDQINKLPSKMPAVAAASPLSGNQSYTPNYVPGGKAPALKKVGDATTPRKRYSYKELRNKKKVKKFEF